MALTKRAPLLLSFGSMIDLGGDSLDRRVRVHGPDDNLELRVDASLLLGVGADERDGTDTLAIQAEVLSISNCQWKSERGARLGKRLAEEDLVALLDKVPDGKGVFEDITRGETLVGHVKEGEVFLLLEQVGELFPLCLGGVDAGGVLRISGSAADAET